MSDIAEVLKSNAELTEKTLCRYYGGIADDLRKIEEAETYSLMGGGKRIRPFLVLEFCRLFGGNADAALPFACALEMIHTYSLIHDDLPCMDNDDYRRGRLTSHKKFDEATAVLAGDSLLTRAFGATAENPFVSPSEALEAVKLLSASAGASGMIGGQILDMTAETNPPGNEKAVVRLHSLKTGALIRAAAGLGCIAAHMGEDRKKREDADRYAAGIGLAFQIVDDILDVVGDEKTLGKSTGSDEKSNKVTFMSFYPLQEARTYAGKVTDDAIAAIRDYPGSETLCDLARFLLRRDH